jgi:hypothetical protein
MCAPIRCVGGRSIPAILRDAWKGKVEPTQAEELAQLVEEHNIKVRDVAHIPIMLTLVVVASPLDHRQD